MRYLKLIYMLLILLLANLSAEYYELDNKSYILQYDTIILRLYSSETYPVSIEIKPGEVKDQSGLFGLFPKLYDDGTHGDEVASDSIYSITIKSYQDFEYTFRLKASITNVIRMQTHQVKVIMPDLLPPYIEHYPDKADDIDDDNDGIADEDEDGEEEDPVAFKSENNAGFDDDNTGSPWGIKTETLKYNAVTIKANITDYDNNKVYGYIKYRPYGSSVQYKSIAMELVAEQYVADIPAEEIYQDMEYYIFAIDERGNTTILDSIGPDVSGNTVTFYHIGDNNAKEVYVLGSWDGFSEKVLLTKKYLSDGSPISKTKSGALIRSGTKVLNKNDVIEYKTYIVIEDENGIEKTTYVNDPRTIPHFSDGSDKFIDKIIVNENMVPIKIDVIDETEPYYVTVNCVTGSYEHDVSGSYVLKPVECPDGTEFLVSENTYDEEIKILVTVPNSNTLPAFPNNPYFQYVNFCRKIEFFDINNRPITKLKKPMIVTFRRPYSAYVETEKKVLAYKYSGKSWIPIGGERTDAERSKEIGFGQPFILRITTPGLFIVALNDREWDYIQWNKMTNLRAKPKVFSPNFDNIADETSIQFFLTASGNPSTVGNAPYYMYMLLSIKIYDIKGNLIRNLADEIEKKYRYTEGTLISYIWDGKDDFGNIVSDGLYVYKVKAQNNDVWVTNDEKNVYFGQGVVVVAK